MPTDNVVKELQNFNLTQEESKAYLFLLRKGPTPAGQIARNINLYRMKTYRVLKSLEERGLIEATIERPQKFVAVPIKNALELLINERKEQVDKLEESKKIILEQWKKFYVEEKIESNKIRIIQGRKSFFNFLEHLIKNADREIHLVTTRNGLYRLNLAGLSDKLETRKKKGVKIQVLTQMDRFAVKAIQGFMEFAEVRHTELSTPLRFIVIDEQDVLTTFAMDDSMSMSSQDDISMWTNAPNYAKTVKAYFANLWT